MDGLWWRASRPPVAPICVLVALVLGIAGSASAQLCDWEPPPVLTAPDVELLSSQPESLRAPGRVAAGPQGKLYVTDPTAGAVVVKDVHGGVAAVHRGANEPLAVAVDAFGTIYLGDQATGTIGFFDAGWQMLGSLGQGAGEFVAATDIAIDPDIGYGLIYVADGGADQVKVYHPDGHLVRTIGSSGSGPGEFDFPSAVWVSPAGEVFVADQNNDRVQVLDRDGAFLRCFGAASVINRSFGRILGLTGDAEGRLYVADGFQGHVRVFDPFGGALSIIGELGDGPGELRTPMGLAIDGTNRLFVASVNSGRLEVFGLDDYVLPPPPGSIFLDGFESGDVHAWSDVLP